MGLIKELQDLFDSYDRENELIFQEMDENGDLNFNNGMWDDTYDIIGYNPPCPICGFEMRYSDTLNLLQCPNCGQKIFGNEFPYHRMPEKEDIDFNTFYNH